MWREYIIWFWGDNLLMICGSKGGVCGSADNETLKEKQLKQWPTLHFSLQYNYFITMKIEETITKRECFDDLANSFNCNVLIKKKIMGHKVVWTHHELVETKLKIFVSLSEKWRRLLWKHLLSDALDQFCIWWKYLKFCMLPSFHSKKIFFLLVCTSFLRKTKIKEFSDLFLTDVIFSNKLLFSPNWSNTGVNLVPKT